MKFSPSVWGPHYWFFLHTVSESYPLYPNQVTKRKYYDLIQNFPLFIPNEEIGNKFSRLLDKYPVTPYLDNRESFVRWVFFIHNKINNVIGKEEISLPVALDKYKDQYMSTAQQISSSYKIKKHLLFLFLIMVCVFLIYINYK